MLNWICLYVKIMIANINLCIKITLIKISFEKICAIGEQSVSRCCLSFISSMHFGIKAKGTGNTGWFFYTAH